MATLIPPKPEPIFEWFHSYQDCKIKMGLKATWPDGKKFGYLALIVDSGVEEPNDNPVFQVAREVLIKKALAKEESVWFDMGVFVAI